MSLLRGQWQCIQFRFYSCSPIALEAGRKSMISIICLQYSSLVAGKREERGGRRARREEGGGRREDKEEGGKREDKEGR